MLHLSMLIKRIRTVPVEAFFFCQSRPIIVTDVTVAKLIVVVETVPNTVIIVRYEKKEVHLHHLLVSTH